MNKPLSAEEMAADFVDDRYPINLVAERSAAYVAFQFGHSSRDEEVRALRSALEKATHYIGGGILTQGVFRETLGGGTEYVRVDTYQGKLYEELKQALQPGREGEGV